MKTIRQVGNYTLLNKTEETGRIIYWIDNGEDDVSEYMDEFEVNDLIDCDNWEFVKKCIDLF